MALPWSFSSPFDHGNLVEENTHFETAWPLEEKEGPLVFSEAKKTRARPRLKAAGKAHPRRQTSTQWDIIRKGCSEGVFATSKASCKSKKINLTNESSFLIGVN